jgi:Glycosyltransferase family 87
VRRAIRRAVRPALTGAHRGAVLAIALLLAGWALTLWVAPWSDVRVSDLFVYRTFADPVLNGSLPYRDVGFEYPPLAAPAIALPGLAGTGEEIFRWAFALWTLAAAIAVVLLCGALARATGGDARRAMLAAALAPPLLGALVRTHFDLFPVALLLTGLLLLVRERPRAGLAVLGLAAVTKAFPLVAVPVALAWLVARGQRREAWQGAVACAAVIAVVTGAAVAASPDGALDAVRYHLDRPVQIESSSALVLLGLDAAGAGQATSVASHRSDGLVHPASDAVTSLFGAAFVAFVALLCAGAAAGAARAEDRAGKSRASGADDRAGKSRARGAEDRAGKSRASGAEDRAGESRAGRGEDRAGGAQPRGAAAGARELVLACLAACTAFALLGKVLSPQFLIWVLPLGALAIAWRLHALAAAVALAAGLTQVEFPAHYFDVVAREPLAIGLVAARNLALLAVLVLSVRALQLRRQEQLLDRGRPALAVRLD